MGTDSVEPEQPLAGGNMGVVSRVGSTVRREAGDWTPTVQSLLSHLRHHGIDWAPEPLGIDTLGREVLGFLEGEVPNYPLPEYVWSEQALRDSARKLRAAHDASVGFEGGPWRQPPREPVEVICHNDFAPYNFVFQNGTLTGVIDWDYAAPGPRVWDLAYLAYRMVPLTDGQRDEVRLSILLEEYGTGITVDELIPVVVARLEWLAEFSDERAIALGNPELAEHAVLYRTDAANLRPSTR